MRVSDTASLFTNWPYDIFPAASVVLPGEVLRLYTSDSGMYRLGATGPQTYHGFDVGFSTDRDACGDLDRGAT